MITLSDVAASQLQAMLQQRHLLDHGLRVFVQGGGCCGLQYGMAFEPAAREGDTILEIKGLELFIDPISALYLEGVEIDYQDTPTGGGFRVENPQASAVCACGSSFRADGGGEAEETCCQ